MRYVVAIMLVLGGVLWVGHLAAQEDQPPVADAGNDQTVALGSTVHLNGSGSFDPDGDPLYYQWAQTGGPAVNLNGVTSATPTFVATSAGDLFFDLVVSDGQLSSAPSVVRVTVNSAGDDDITDDDTTDDDAVWNPANDDKSGCGF
jgi:hypothetical protein